MGRAKEIIVKVIPAKIANEFVKKHHYSGKVVNSQVHFGCFLDNKLHGVLQYGPPTKKQEQKLQESLTKFGVVEPIIFNKQTGYIVGGHFRVRELKKLGYKEVECVVVDLNEADEKELNIRLNANTDDWDWDTLANEWDVEKLDEWGLDLPDEWGEEKEVLYVS